MGAEIGAVAVVAGQQIAAQMGDGDNAAVLGGVCGGGVGVCL